MASKVLRTYCGFGEQCPEVRSLGEGMLAVTGYKPGMPHVPEHEVTIEVPATLIPGVTDLDIPNFSEYLAQVRRTPGDILRVQTLSQYGVASDQDYFVRYMEGRSGPSETELQGWGQRLDSDRASGRVHRNLHVIGGPLSDYLRYQFEWAYTFNARHGMDIRIVDAAEISALSSLLELGDFWVLEHQYVVLCRYDDEGRPLGTVGVDASGTHGYIAAAEIAWQLGTSFAKWWAEHPQYHRKSQRAA